MSLRFVQISDHHLGDDAGAINRGYATAWALERVLDAIDAADGHGADFLLSTGDLVDVGTPEAYRFAASLLGVTPAGRPPGPLRTVRGGRERAPTYLIPGNHDPRDAWCASLFPDAALEGPHLDLAWDVADTAFVHLDQGTSGRAGTLREASLAFLDEVLSLGRPTVLVLHHHPIPVGVPWLDRAVPEGVDRLWSRLDRPNLLGVLFGHAHASVDRRVAGVPVLGLRSTCFQFAASEEPSFVIQPLHYRLVSIERGVLDSALYEVPLTGDAVGRRVA